MTQDHVRERRRLREIQGAQIGLFAITPIPLVLLFRFLQQPPDSMLFGLGQFLEATFIELLLAFFTFWLLNKIYRKGPRWTLKQRRITYGATAFSILTLYVANVNILIVLPAVICGMGLTTLLWAQRKIREQKE